MKMKFAVLSAKALEEGKVYISPAHLIDTRALADQRAEFASEAYNEDQIVLELRPVRRVTGKKRRGV